ncbi:MAG: DUF3426 domain-containing protein [Gammaproteobacteria bacterium]|nr:DUF3426 domain-containing protein [Gammaproteobacteria bacterium]
MYTECPSCQTFFKITPNQLKAAGGKVRCGNCDEIFSALDGLVDVVPEDVVSEIKADLPEDANESFSESLSLPVSDIEVASEPVQQGGPADTNGISQADEFSQLLADQVGDEIDEIEGIGKDDESLSFADVEIPGMDDVADLVEDDAELALAGDMPSVPGTEEAETKSITEQEEINQDIDAALDGLFDGNTEILESASSPDLGTPSTPSELSSISELDELQDLDFGNIGKIDAAATDSSATSLGSNAELSLDDDLMDRFGSDKSETSSLSEFERELGQSTEKVTTGVKSKALDDSSFDLGDSFLDSEMDLGEKRESSIANESDVYSGDSFILEELGEEKSKSTGNIAKVAWVSVILVLLIVLFGQFAYLKRQDLAMYPEIKPIIESLCENLNKVYPCDIAPARDVAAIELLERNVISHPNAKNALLITSTIENKADFDQPYPNLILTFSDINQKIIAKRKFIPTEYLSKDVNIEAGMKAGTPVKLMLEIVDPGEEAVNFEFNFQ